MHCITIRMRNNKKDKNIIIRLTSTEKQKLQGLADKQGRTLSNLVRFLLRKELKGRK